MNKKINNKVCVKLNITPIISILYIYIMYFIIDDIIIIIDDIIIIIDDIIIIIDDIIILLTIY